jgi:integrase/recombinase XerD
MILSEAVEAYIVHKRSLGMGFRGEAVRLRAFVQSIGDRNMRLVRPKQVLRFLEGAGPITSFWFAKYHTLNAFYRYALAREYCSKCPLPLSLPQKPERFQPYIYTNRDIERLIDAADSRHRHVWLLEPDTMRTLLLLLYGSGLRISEALHLRTTDFDTDAGVLTIRETKFFKSRFVPVGPDLSRVLRDYALASLGSRHQHDPCVARSCLHRHNQHLCRGRPAAEGRSACPFKRSPYDSLQQQALERRSVPDEFPAISVVLLRCAPKRA